MSATDGRAIKTNTRIRNKAPGEGKLTFPSRMRNRGKEWSAPLPWCAQPPHPAGLSAYKRRGLRK